MKEKIFSYSVDSDISTIEFDIYDAAVKICASPDGTLKVAFPCARNMHVANAESELYITQTKRPLFSRAKQLISVYVPDYIVPSVRFIGVNYSVEAKKGIYKEFAVNGECAALTLSDSVSESVEIICENVSAHLINATVKGNFFVQAKQGVILAENTFASLAELHLKSGNIGLSGMNCKEGAFETGAGNVTVTLSGAESDYSLSVTAREGTANRESKLIEGAAKSVKAYTEKGNIVLDFSQKESSGEDA